MWFGCDDADMVAYVPVYCCERDIPTAFREENNLNGTFNEKGAYWMCNFVSNMIYPRYSALIGSLREKQEVFEDLLFASQEELEKTAAMMTATDRPAFLSSVTTTYVEQMMSLWNDLAKEIIVKYNDQPGGYDQRFYDAIARDTGDRYKIPE